MRIESKERKLELLNRLKRAEGQLRGVQKMIEEDADCVLIASQLAAARSAIHQTFGAFAACAVEESARSNGASDKQVHQILKLVA